MITKYSNFSKIEILKQEFEEIFNHCKIDRNYLLCSDITDKSGNPNVRIDSKTPTKSIKIKISDDSLTFISINNSTGERGLFLKIMNVLDKVINNNSTIYVDQDVSGGFWEYIKDKYPKYNWIIL